MVELESSTRASSAVFVPSAALPRSRMGGCCKPEVATDYEQVVKLASSSQASSAVFVPSAAPPEVAVDLPTTVLPLGPSSRQRLFDLDKVVRPSYLPEVLSRARRECEYLFLRI